jgi:integrase
MARKDGKDRGIFQRKDRPGWWVRVYVNGRAQTFRCDNKTQAKALYGRLKADIREKKFFPEQFAPSKDITLRAWIRRYLDGCSNRGVGNEERYGRRWSLLLGGRLLREITTEELRRLQTTMRARRLKFEAFKQQGKTQTGKGWSDATINRHFSFLRHVLMLAMKEGWINRNPVSGVKFFPEVNRTRFLNDDELHRLQNVMSAEDWKLVAFAIETGLRQGEQFPLRWDQVDLENGVLTIPMPKGGRTRHVPLSDGAKDLLRSLESFLTSAYVFPGIRGKESHPLDARAFERRSYEPALRRVGIQGACWHTLRHTAASRRVMAGVDLVTVKEIMGHQDIETTLRYAHLAPAHLKDGVNRGSLFASGIKSDSGTVTKTVTKERPSEKEKTQPIDSVARPTGVEPVTPRSVVWCSIH